MTTDVQTVYGIEGLIFNPTDIDERSLIAKNTTIVVRDDKIEYVGNDSIQEVKRKFDCLTADDTWMSLDDNQFVIPGFIDTHIHACQYPNLGLGQDLPLLDWLNKYTYPLEKEYANLGFATEVYTQLVQDLLRSGTTCASYFGSIHRASTEILADKCREFGQRALVGKGCADINTPADYTESTQESVSECRLFVESQLKQKGNSLVLPTITPRFAVTCSQQLISELVEIKNKYDLHAQTHINENLVEVDVVKKLHPNKEYYVDVYKDAGLLGPKTVLAHCVHSKPYELNEIGTSASGVAHCPTSNICLRSGLCDIRELQTNRINVGLGSDVSGGFTPHMTDVMRSAIDTSKVLSFSKYQEQDYNFLNHEDALYMATLGGAKALGVQDVTGNFEVSKKFDALIIRTPNACKTHFPLSSDHRLEKFVYTGNRSNIIKVYVDGKLVTSQ